MRRVLALLLAAVTTACAGITGPDAPGTATPLAYEIEAPGGGRALLFGSVHIARAREAELPDQIVQALADADLLVLEIDIRELDPDEMRELVRGLGAMPPGQRLRQVVSDDTWELLEQRAGEAGIPLEELDRQKPWAVALRFMLLSLQQAGFDSRHGVERSVVGVAPELPVRGLETPYEQLSAFDDLPYPVQDQMLRETLRPRRVEDGQLDALLSAWRRGDARALESIIFEGRDDPRLARFYEATYDRRNARMVESLDEILTGTRRAFVVVGAGHLVGRQSIPSLLREEGWDVRQVSGQRP